MAALKTTIKATAKAKYKLRQARKDAERGAAKAAQHAATAELKHDRAVLADMVHREKDNDLLVHSDDKTTATHGGDSHRAPTTTRPRSDRKRARS